MNLSKYGTGWRCQVYKNGTRKSATFATKTEARDWGRLTEITLAQKQQGDFSFGNAVDKYLEEVSSKKDGERWERLRLEVMREHFGADTKLSEIDSPQVAGWRDARLQAVTASTVLREVNLLRNLFNIARLEWHWMEHEPFKGIKLPKENEARHQRWPWTLIKRVLRAPRVGKTAEMQKAFHIALRTGMRLQEVLAAPDNYDAKRKVVTIKTKTEARAVIPIGRIADKLILQARFTVKPNEGSVLFSKLCRELMIKELTFHDARATALTLLSKKVDVMVLARISRHRDISLLHRVYYRVTTEEIAAKI